VIRGFAPTIGLLTALAPAAAHAQTNLDQGKSAAQIFASDCAECHKAAHGLANGRNNTALTDFLREHYTTSRDQAAALAAYVLGGRGADSGAAQAHGPKPNGEHAGASAEKPEPGKRQARQPDKPEEATAEEPKPAKRQPPATARLHRPTDEAPAADDDAAESEQPAPTAPAARSGGGQHQPRPATAARTRRKEPKSSAPAELATPADPAAVAHAPAVAMPEPAPVETPPIQQEASPAPTAAAPGDAASGESAPVPRDDIPD
jgi:hypothetical protein